MNVSYNALYQSITFQFWMDRRPLEALSLAGKFHKGSQEKKHFSCGRSFSCVQPAPLSRFVLAFRSVNSGRYDGCVALLVFSPSGFHHFFATKPVRSETNKQYGCQVATMVPLGTRGP